MKKNISTIIIILSCVSGFCPHLFANESEWDATQQSLHTSMHKEGASKAIQKAQASLAIAIQSFGKNHSKTAISYRKLSDAYMLSGMYEEASEALKKAINIWQSSTGLSGNYLTEANLALARIERQKNNLIDAEIFYHKALSIQETTLGSLHTAVSKTLTEIADLYWNNQEQEKAISYLRRVLWITKKIDNKNNTYDSIDMYKLLGDKNLQIGKGDLATKYYEAALAVRKTENNRKNEKWLPQLEDLALIKKRMKYFVEAEGLLLQIVEIVELSNQKDKELLRRTFYQLRELYLEIGDVHKAELMNQRAQGLM